MKNKTIDEAYSLYMPQIRAEIEELYSLVENHYGFTPKSTPYNILEIGTKFGGTFYLWNSINKSGLNLSIDVSDGGLHGGISDEEMDKRDLWFCERFDNCRFIRGNSHDDQTLIDIAQLLLKLWKGPDSNVGIDFLFIDGDHTYEGVERDFQMYSPLVNDGGLIVFHDIVDSKRHRDRQVNVAQFWNELKNSGKYKIREIIHPDTTNPDELWGGIGIVFM